MKRLVLVLALAALAGCASFNPRSVAPGQSAADVEAKLGQPAEKRARPDGETWLYYPQQPYGLESWVARIGRDGRLLALEQRLTDENVARIERGKTTAEQARELLGPPYKVWEFPRMQRQILEYRMRSVSSTVPFGLYVQASPDGIVREVFMEGDPDARLSDTGGSTNP